MLRSGKHKTIKRYSTHSIVEAQSMTQLVPECATQMGYFVLSDSSFCVLSDQSTVIGVSDAYQNMIIKRSIIDTSGPIVTYTANLGRVYTLAVDEPQSVLFAGGSGCDSDGQLVQYELCAGQVVKAFSRIGMDTVLKSISVNNL